jgi:hypothetical protein
MTIDDILTAFAAGTITQEQASQQLRDLMDTSARLDAFACAALSGLLATDTKWASDRELAKQCFAYADAMAKVGAQKA